MAKREGNPQIDNGDWFRMSNEIQEALTGADFTKYERRLIDLILRLTYGWDKLYAEIEYWSDLRVARIPKQHARKTAESLVAKKVISLMVKKKGIRFRLNKYYREWKVDMANEWDRYHELIDLNGKLKGNTPVTSDPTGEGAKVTPLLPKSNTPVTSAAIKVNDTNVVATPKDSKDNNYNNNMNELTKTVLDLMNQNGLSDQRKRWLKNGFIPNGDFIVSKFVESAYPGCYSHGIEIDKIRMTKIVAEPIDHILDGIEAAFNYETKVTTQYFLKFLLNHVEAWDYWHKPKPKEYSIEADDIDTLNRTWKQIHNGIMTDGKDPNEVVIILTSYLGKVTQYDGQLDFTIGEFTAVIESWKGRIDG